MPIINFSGMAQADIGKLYVFDGNDFDQMGKVYYHDGTANSLIYSAEEVKSNLSVGCLNYYEYNSTASGTSSASWNLSGFSSVSFSWS